MALRIYGSIFTRLSGLTDLFAFIYRIYLFASFYKLMVFRNCLCGWMYA